MYGTIVLAVTILIIKGSGGDGQTTLFNTFVKRYIEETSASILSSNRPNTSGYLADISGLTAWENGSAAMAKPGQGGPEPSLEPTTIQDNSVFSHNPAATDYIEKTADKRVQVVEYTVQPGDKLSFIALDYGVSIESIMWANNLRDSDSIRPEQVLKIPPISGIIHIVKKGDTVGSIAKKYGVEVENVVAYNGLPQDGQLQIDDEIIVPDGKIKGSSGIATTRTSPFSHLPSLGDYFLIPTTGYNWGRIHGRNGVDIANSCGTNIFAAANGSVATSDAVGWNGGFGKYIKLIHPNGTETLYAHNSKLLVGVGETVSRGQLIASMGSTGRSTGCHLHFEVHGARNPLVK
ncbi:MAG: hypothetical protein A2918_03775 [Candidatus Yanofskybacteria bacterium RIFCSPLOWO2_01_FULL_42_49]|uniref:LysM domain-containing protein n=1 Tax=Candidatus Yanofskybacteria bacterium RIFCSPLOWO2_01_FULL_42_49 TaxID=1802694 RepID=A0A1F8GDM2_9BACT|nr:MAG: hypothetical protein A2918_03775 [Candidatus Yanofskybacteria bacterium RIFCSPLOWO2_01_FULL_42_49]